LTARLHLKSVQFIPSMERFCALEDDGGDQLLALGDRGHLAENEAFIQKRALMVLLPSEGVGTTSFNLRRIAPQRWNPAVSSQPAGMMVEVSQANGAPASIGTRRWSPLLNRASKLRAQGDYL
jgi:hypothetical protein